jgi:hypothetical protein
MKMHRKLKAIILTFAVATGMVLAAASFVANDQPYGWIAPPVLTSVDLSSGDALAFTPWFETGTFKGDILALRLAAHGVPDPLNPVWRASIEVDAQDWLAGRHIVTTNGAGLAYSFLWASLPAAQQAALGAEEVLNFVRGDRTNEGAGLNYRLRYSTLGDIIHANPVYVGKPRAGYLFDNYLTFAAAKAARAGRVYSGHNDGMLHAWDAETGEEVFAYVPSTVIPNLSKLTADPYNHTYFVDGPMTAEDAFFGGVWHSLLVAGLGAGGKGFFALDVTDPSVVSDADAADKALWEFHSGSAGADNLGYGYSRPSIVRMADDKWYVVIGNGYLSATGVASLLILDPATGSVAREIVVSDADANGMSSPTLIDSDGDYRVDMAYAGDLNGNLWKFDLSAGDPASWSLAHAEPLFVTDAAGTGQPITSAPDVGNHPHGGFMVYIATGKLFSTDDGSDLTQQAVYGLWDNAWPDPPIDPAALVTQLMRYNEHPTGGSVRTVTDNAVDWASDRGWKTPTEIENAPVLDQGERVLQDVVLRDNRIQFMSSNPTVVTGDNWFVQLDAFTGGAPPRTIIDVNVDFALTVADNVDGDGNGSIEDDPEDRVAGQYQDFGLASRPIIGIISKKTSAALINHLAAIDPVPPEFIFDPTDPGLQGGHFDLDSSHLIYPFGDGETDGHEHEWDDSYNSTTIDYFQMRGKPFKIDHEVFGAGNKTADPFILTVGNSALSPGGIVEINGVSIGVEEYEAALNRYITGTLAAGEGFPRFTIDPPTVAQKNAGVLQLTTFKMSFDAFAILRGDLLGTKTGCVKDNTAGRNGEWRNGALFVQALDAKWEDPAYVLDVLTDTYVGVNNSVKAGHNYATDGLLWESTVFWHWDDSCYHEDDWVEEWRVCIIEAGCAADLAKDDKAKKKKKAKKGEEPVPDPGDPPLPDFDYDPSHTLTNSTIADDVNNGRLFWRELIPSD